MGPPTGPFGPVPGPQGPSGPGPYPPQQQWAAAAPVKRPDRSRTAGIAIAVVAAVLVIGGGGIAAVTYFSGGPVLAEPDRPCPGLEDSIASKYDPQEDEQDSYYTCSWTLTDPDAASTAPGSDPYASEWTTGSGSGSLSLNVEYEAVSEPVGGSDPEDLAGFLLKYKSEELDSELTEVKDEDALADLGDEAWRFYSVYSTDTAGFELGTSTVLVRRANIVITVAVSGTRGGAVDREAVPASDLHPVAEDMAEAAVAGLDSRPA